MVKLHEKSVEYMHEVFEMYTKAELRTDTIITNPIIHLYAMEDTYNDEGELNGYLDSLFFRADIYDTIKLLKYTSEGLHDSVNYYEIYPSHVKIFKDGSTMLTFQGETVVHPLTTLNVHDAKSIR